MDQYSYDRTLGRIENWGRWAGGGTGTANGRCGSIEGRYVREKADEERLKRESKIPVDVDDAELVEKAVLAIRGKRIRFLLVGKFVYFRRKEDLCRKLKIDWRTFDACVLRCVYEVHGHLERQKLFDKVRDAIRPRPIPALA